MASRSDDDPAEDAAEPAHFAGAVPVAGVADAIPGHGGGRGVVHDLPHGGHAAGAIR